MMADSGMDRLRPLALICLSLSACGGGGGESSPEPAPAPLAQASADRYDLTWNAPATSLKVLENDKASGGEAQLSIAEAPKNGTATVAGGTISYTPRPGFYGEDSFSYGLAVGSARSTGQVTLSITAALSLQGLVHDGPIANAKLSARIGDQLFETTTDAQGRYTLPVVLKKPGDFVSLSARGSGDQSHVELNSLLGEASQLALAAEGGTVTDTRLPALRVNHLSSATAGLIAQGKAQPRTQAELQQASAALSQQELLNAAALVKLVIDHQVALPSGIASTRDLLSSASALAGFQKTQQNSNWRKLQQAQDDTADDPLLSRAPVLGGDAGTTRIFYLSHGVGGASSPEAMRLALQPDGRALLDWSGSPREAAWKLEADALVLKFDTPYIEEMPAQAPESGNERWTTTGLRIQDRGAGNGLFTPVGLRRVGESRHVDYPQITRDLGKSVQLLRRYEAKALVGLDAAALATGKRWIGLNAGSLAQGLQQDILKITGASTARFERSGLELSWARSADGVLELSFPEGKLQHRYVRLGLGPLGEERWLLEEWLDGKFQRADDIMVLEAPATVPALADAAATAGLWSSNLKAQYLEPARYYLRTDGRAAVESGIPTPGQPEQAPSFDQAWRLLPDGRLEMARGLTAQNVVCDPFAAAATCRVSSRRFWTLMAVRDAVSFVIEQGPGTLTSYRFVATQRSALP